MAPKGTPADIVNKLNDELRKVLADPDIQSRLRVLGYEPSGTLNAREVADFVTGESRKWGELIRAANLKAE